MNVFSFCKTTCMTEGLNLEKGIYICHTPLLIAQLRQATAQLKDVLAKAQLRQQTLKLMTTGFNTSYLAQQHFHQCKGIESRTQRKMTNNIFSFH